jgi:alpha-ketoglutarate-dependent taurine dioxygenase
VAPRTVQHRNEREASRGRELNELRRENNQLKRKIARLQKQVARILEPQSEKEEELVVGKRIVEVDPADRRCPHCSGTLAQLELPTGKKFMMCKPCKYRETV